MTGEEIIQRLDAAVDAAEFRIERLFSARIAGIAETLGRIETRVAQINGRVTTGEEWRIKHDAREQAIHELTKELAMQRAVRDSHGVKWWSLVVAAIAATATVIGTISSVVGAHLAG